MQLKLEVKSLKLEGELHQDLDTDPLDFDNLSKTRIQAFQDNEWTYIGIVCVADIIGEINGNEVEFRLQGPSLWGMASDDLEYRQQVLNDLAEEFCRELGVPLESVQIGEL